jgi:hypothetical protein
MEREEKIKELEKEIERLKNDPDEALLERITAKETPEETKETRAGTWAPGCKNSSQRGGF